MATSMTTLSRTLYRSLLSNSKFSQISKPFSTYYDHSSSEDSSDSESDDSLRNSDIDSDAQFSSSNTTKASEESAKPVLRERPLENGLDAGVFKAMLLGQVGQTPVQRRLRNGRTTTTLIVGTGGIRNNRRPFDNEQPQDYANRSNIQWHRVLIYPEALGDLVMKNAVPGTMLYLEGNLETKIFTDPLSGLARRIREVAVRRNGRIVFLGTGSGEQEKASSSGAMRSAGYF